MADLRITSTPTFRDLQGRFSQANAKLLSIKRDEMRDLGRGHVRVLQRHAPKKSGEFASGITFRTFAKGETIGYTTSSPQPLGKWLRPPGTKPHVIRAKNAKTLRFFWAKAGRVVYPKSVNHPGYRPKSDFVEEGNKEYRPAMLAGLRRISTRYKDELI